jgi:Holliday junction resolvase RusA-like endonuclease
MSDQVRLTFFVPGIAKPGGSKKGFVNKKTGRVIITDMCGKNKEWRTTVEYYASEAVRAYIVEHPEHRDRFPIVSPVFLRLDFLMERPGYHYGVKGLKENAPKRHCKSPDITKLTRSTEDALKDTQLVFLDDCQVYHAVQSKKYATAPDEQPGCWITVLEMADGQVTKRKERKAK